MKEQVTLKKHDATTSTVTLTSDGWRVERKKIDLKFIFLMKLKHLEWNLMICKRFNELKGMMK